MWWIVKTQLCGLIDLLKSTTPCVLSPLHRHFQETSKDKSPEMLSISFGVLWPFPRHVLRVQGALGLVESL